jgi:hypothetical protein
MGYEKKKERYISDFEGFKILKIMEKQKSIFRVEFRTDDPEEELVDVLKYRKKSGAVTERNIIMDTQVERWTQIYKNEGFSEV